MVGWWGAAMIALIGRRIALRLVVAAVVAIGLPSPQWFVAAAAVATCAAVYARRVVLAVLLGGVTWIVAWTAVTLETPPAIHSPPVVPPPPASQTAPAVQSAERAGIVRIEHDW